MTISSFQNKLYKKIYERFKKLDFHSFVDRKLGFNNRD